MGDKERVKDDFNNTHKDSDDPVWSILPSYEMYASTLVKDSLPSYTYSSSTLSNESTSMSDNNTIISQSNHRGSSSEQTSLNNLLNPVNGFSSQDALNENYIVTNENENNWTATILENIHNLRNLTDTENELAKSLTISIYFTKDVGEIHKEPEIIDPLLYEFKKGDFVNGHLYVINNSETTIPFEMLYVLFEGHFLVSNPKNESKPLKYKKFLEMFDFSASYNEVQVDRLISEHTDSRLCPLIIDSIDGANTGILHRLIVPHVKYKRFFTFKIPERLLDSECNDHHLPYHTVLPPSMGVLNIFPLKEQESFKDFAFKGASTSYGVMVRIIGKASSLNETREKPKNEVPTLINSDGDEFVIFKESHTPIRVLQQENITETEAKIKAIEIQLLKKNLISRLKEKIEIGEEMVKSLSVDKFNNTLDLSTKLEESNKNELVKARQLYRTQSQAKTRDVKEGFDLSKKQETYRKIIPLTKRKLLSSKPLGALDIISLKSLINMKYIPPPKFRKSKAVDASSWKFKIPLQLNFTGSSLLDSSSSSADKSLPDLKNFRCDLVVLTLQSVEHDIPLQLDHSFIFNNEFQKFYSNPIEDEDTFINNTRKKFREFAKQYYQLFKTLGTDNFRVESSLINELKGICDIEDKITRLRVHDFKVSDSTDPESKEAFKWELNQEKNSFEQNLTLDINVKSAELSYVNPKDSSGDAFDKYCLVPSYQICNSSRMYYFDLSFLLSANEYIHVKVPAIISND
ncbi:hypothetical protein HYPBUDRAFT_137805 [Hyphopichia burtonii NRRL Y-1933]|uniref:Bul1 N-terminal domain-containing protein n=1 Tax=Hyphopichia burtonii NRRL Y-1933 TaxID=984485 RepID=A0A1E4RKV8_9ASCO|nr:hypothetical protein HYPBUDRAFT_137805 [Hyphopichia burtonii NRRL Y-1933]ODV67914.1 hypothetical protein HYPBUDRAFT_137805 [Hyphopichia burtonii NRRL Y-1933]